MELMLKPSKNNSVNTTIFVLRNKCLFFNKFATCFNL